MPSTTLIRLRMGAPAVVPDVADRLRPSTRRYELSMRWAVGPASAAPASPLVCTWISRPSTVSSRGEDGCLSDQPGLVESDPGGGRLDSANRRITHAPEVGRAAWAQPARETP